MRGESWAGEYQKVVGRASQEGLEHSWGRSLRRVPGPWVPPDENGGEVWVWLHRRAELSWAVP